MDRAPGPPPVSLTVTRTGEAIRHRVTFPYELGHFAFRRALITPLTAPAPGTMVTLHIDSRGIEDLFFNPASGDFDSTFYWPAASEVIYDAAPPRVEQVLTRSGRLEIGFSEVVDLTAAERAIEIDGKTISWEQDPSGYYLRSVEPFDETGKTLVIGTGVVDLAGKGLRRPLTLPLTPREDSPDAAVERRLSEAAITPLLGGPGKPTPPELLQLRFHDGSLQLEFSEEVLRSALENGGRSRK